MNSPDHDWRINPFVVLPTDPPRRQIVCAECSETSSVDEQTMDSLFDVHNPVNWPRLY